MDGRSLRKTILTDRGLSGSVRQGCAVTRVMGWHAVAARTDASSAGTRRLVGFGIPAGHPSRFSR